MLFSRDPVKRSVKRIYRLERSFRKAERRWLQQLEGGYIGLARDSRQAMNDLAHEIEDAYELLNSLMTTRRGDA